MVHFDAVLPQLTRLGKRRERMVLSVEVDLDAGEEDPAVRRCFGYLADRLGRGATRGLGEPAG